eukprot:COSAG06_NODE_90_length_24779_cov_33.515843_2_plen_56_part_00
MVAEMHACYAYRPLAYAAMDDNAALASDIDDNPTCIAQSVRTARIACTICETVFW